MAVSKRVLGRLTESSAQGYGFFLLLVINNYRPLWILITLPAQTLTPFLPAVFETWEPRVDKSVQQFGEGFRVWEGPLLAKAARSGAPSGRGRHCNRGRRDGDPSATVKQSLQDDNRQEATPVEKEW